jgi:hypothetical protein
VDKDFGVVMAKDTFAQWITASKGDLPDEGSHAVLTDWFDIGVVRFAGKTINIGDRWLHGDAGDVTLEITPGSYRVQARGASFGGHRRVAGVRVFLEKRESVAGKTLGQISVDSWGILIGDLNALYAGMSEDEIESFQEKKLLGKYAHSCEIVSFKPKGNRPDVPFVTAFTGLGAGDYPAIALNDGNTLVGVRVDFIDHGMTIGN